MRSEFEYKIFGPGSLDHAREIGADRRQDAGAFTKELGKALAEVERTQIDADKEADLVARGGGNLHELAIALEKADVSMRLALKVRNKVVDTYNEIMRMSV